MTYFLQVTQDMLRFFSSNTVVFFLILFLILSAGFFIIMMLLNFNKNKIYLFFSLFIILLSPICLYIAFNLFGCEYTYTHRYDDNSTIMWWPSLWGCFSLYPLLLITIGFLTPSLIILAYFVSRSVYTPNNNSKQNNLKSINNTS